MSLRLPASIIFWEFRRVWAGKSRLREGILGQPPSGICTFQAEVCLLLEHSLSSKKISSNWSNNRQPYTVVKLKCCNAICAFMLQFN